MSHIIEISSFDAPELDIYARTSENQLVNRANPAEAMFIAESPRVIERALDAGYEPVSCLVENGSLQEKQGRFWSGWEIFLYTRRKWRFWRSLQALS